MARGRAIRACRSKRSPAANRRLSFGLVVIDYIATFPWTCTFDVKMLWHPRTEHSPAHMWLREVMVDCARHT